MSIQTDNGFLAHWMDYTTGEFYLAFVNFAGDIKKKVDVSPYMNPNNVSLANLKHGVLPIENSYYHNIMLASQETGDTIVLNRLDFSLLSMNKSTPYFNPLVPFGFLQNYPLTYKITPDKLSVYSTYNNTDILKTDTSISKDVIEFKLTSGASPNSPLTFVDMNNNFYAIYYSVNVAVGGDTITFTVYKNNLKALTQTFTLNDHTTNGSGVQAGAMIGKYNIQDNSIYLATGYKLGSTGVSIGESQGVAVDSSYLYVSNTNNNEIQVFDLSGNFVKTIGSGILSIPSGIAVDSTYIYVCDRGNDRIVIFKKFDLTYTTFGSYGSGNGQFNSPSGIAVDSSHIYVVDTGNVRVQIFNLTGTYQSKFTGTGAGLLQDPFGIAVDSSHIYVTDMNVLSNNIKVYDLLGNNSFQFTALFSEETGIDVTASNIYLTGGGVVEILNLSGVSQSHFSVHGTTLVGYLSLNGIAINQNNIFLTNSFSSSNDYVQIFNTSGVWIKSITSLTSNPYAQLINIYRYDLRNNIQKTFEYYNQTDPTIEPIYPVDITWDYNNKAYLAVADLNITANTGAFKILSIDSSTTYSVKAVLESFNSVTDLDNQNFFSITSYYTDTRSIALSQKTGSIMPNNIPYYKIIPISQRRSRII